MSETQPSSGFTLIELMIVVAIVGTLSVVLLFFVPQYFTRRQDTVRKSDLASMKIAFEDYAADHTCYPTAAELAQCGSQDLSPYMKRVPCDPDGETPYTYIRSSDCLSYQLFTNLELTDDPDIEAIGCSGGCGPAGAFNYGVAGGGAKVTD